MSQSLRRPDGIKVIHLSTAHLADDIRIFWKECVSLAQAGYSVSFVVPDDRFTDASDAYVTLQGVDIVAVKRRSGRLARMMGTTIEIVVAGLRRNGHIYHFHDPELIPAGLLLRLVGKRVIYDVHEDVPRDILTKEWIPRYLRRPLSLAAGGAEWIAARALSGVVAATPVIARRFESGCTVLVQNFALRSEFSAGNEGVYEKGNSVAYVGSIRADRCVMAVVEALASLERFPEVRLAMAGLANPPSLMKDLMASPGWLRVDYWGHQDRAGVDRLLAESRAGIALYRPQQSHFDCQPHKLFEYMAAGLPVIAPDFPNFRKIVEVNRCGLCVPPCDTRAIASAIEWIFEHPAEAEEMGRRGRELVEASLNWSCEERELLRFYERVIGAR